MSLGGRFAVAVETPLLVTVRAAIARRRLLDRGDRVVVAVSGGPDSVALLHALTLLAPEHGLALTAAHVHHGLRPEADADAALVAALAARLGWPAVVERVTVPLGRGRSPEEAARHARLAALGRVADAAGATRIALGHTADDQAETVLMRVLQGAGPRGLAGIPARRGRLVRPLLGVDRTEVLAHLQAHGLASVEDATNREARFLRNRIRHELLPLLRAHAGPAVDAALLRTARASRETVEALDLLLAPRLPALVRPAPGGCALDLGLLRGLPPGAVKALLRLALARVAPPGPLSAGLRAGPLVALAALLDAPVGTRVRLPGGIAVERARESLWVAQPATRLEPVAVAVPGETPVVGACLWLTAEVDHPAAGRPTDPLWEAWFDADRLPAQLEVRAALPHERIVPFGGLRAVRVAGLLAAAGVPRPGRAEWPVLAGRGDADRELLWVIGVRRGAAAPVTAGTRAMVRLRARLGNPLTAGGD